MQKVLIVGTGPAGLTAALYTARAGLEPVVVDGQEPGGQLMTTDDVENYPGFPEAVKGVELVDKMREQAERFGATCRSGIVESADFKGQPLTVTLSGGEVIEAKSCIIATGASAIYLGLESEQHFIGNGVSGCAVCDGRFYTGAPVAVVGGGDSAMEESLYLSRLASRVTVIHRRDEFRASRIMSDRVKSSDKIDILWDTVVTEVLDVSRNMVTGLVLENVKTGARSELAVDGVFMAIGHRPNSEAFKDQLDLDDKGFIIASDTRTSVPGVFAAGDIQDHVYRQAVTAAASGCMAAIQCERYLITQDS